MTKKETKKRRSVWILEKDIRRIEEIIVNENIGFSNTRTAINYLIEQHSSIQKAKRVINNHDLNSDDCLQQLVDIFN